MCRKNPGFLEVDDKKAPVFDVTDLMQHDGDRDATQFVHWSKTQAFFVTIMLGAGVGLTYTVISDVVIGGHEADETVDLVLHLVSQAIGWGSVACLFLLPLVAVRNLSLRSLKGKALEKKGGKWRIKEALIFSPVSGLLMAAVIVGSNRVVGPSTSFGKFVYTLSVCVMCLATIAVAAALMTILRNIFYPVTK